MEGRESELMGSESRDERGFPTYNSTPHPVPFSLIHSLPLPVDRRDGVEEERKGKEWNREA